MSGRGGGGSRLCEWSRKLQYAEREGEADNDDEEGKEDGDDCGEDDDYDEGKDGGYGNGSNEEVKEE